MSQVNFLVSMGMVFLTLVVSPQVVVGQEKDPFPEETIRIATEAARLGEAYLKSKGWYENYDRIRKDFKAPFVSVKYPKAWGTGARFKQGFAENKIQRMSLSISALRVRQLREQGIDVVDSVLRNEHNPGNIWVTVLRTEVIVGGRVIGGVERPGAGDKFRRSALLVVTEVYRGDVSVGDTLHVVMAGNAHDALLMGKSGGYDVQSWHANVIYALAQKSFPLINSPELKNPKELGKNEYLAQDNYRVSGEHVTGVIGTANGVRVGTKQDIRNVIKIIDGRK